MKVALAVVTEARAAMVATAVAAATVADGAIGTVVADRVVKAARPLVIRVGRLARVVVAKQLR